MFRPFQTCVFLLLLHHVTPEVFLDDKAASELLTRRRRANSPFEEFYKGNKERECVEERCDKEEAREIFEDDEQTNEFWNVYYDGDACVSNPCANGGVCKDGIGMYTCFCNSAYRGKNCEIVIPELCDNRNGGCVHFCNVEHGFVRCSCADGYYLGSDDKSCFSNETYKCGVIFEKNTRSLIEFDKPVNATATNSTGDGTVNGTDDKSTNNITVDATSYHHIIEPIKFDVPQSDITWQLDDLVVPEPVVEAPVVSEVRPETRIVGGEECRPGQCPWQALLLNEAKIGFCGGTILTEYFILTAAHCMNQSRSIYVVLGEFDKEEEEGHEAGHEVETVLIHSYYRPDTFHNDIALIKLKNPIQFTKYILPACLPERDFAEKVLMQQPDGMVSGFGRVAEGKPPSPVLLRLAMPYVDRATCMESSKFKISHRMFCAGYDKEKKDACQGDSGGPHVTKYLDTYFVTGVVSWGEGCARQGKYGIYTQVSKYIDWIRKGMARIMQKDNPNDSIKGPGRKKRSTASFQTFWV